MGKTWKTGIYAVNGRRRKAKVRTIGGKRQIRIVGTRNRTDKGAGRRLGKLRKRRFANTTDSGPRQHRIRRRR